MTVTKPHSETVLPYTLQSPLEIGGQEIVMGLTALTAIVAGGIFLQRCFIRAEKIPDGIVHTWYPHSPKYPCLAHKVELLKKGNQLFAQTTIPSKRPFSQESVITTEIPCGRPVEKVIPDLKTYTPVILQSGKTCEIDFIKQDISLFNQELTLDDANWAVTLATRNNAEDLVVVIESVGPAGYSVDMASISIEGSQAEGIYGKQQVEKVEDPYLLLQKVTPVQTWVQNRENVQKGRASLVHGKAAPFVPTLRNRWVHEILVRSGIPASVSAQAINNVSPWRGSSRQPSQMPSLE